MVGKSVLKVCERVTIFDFSMEGIRKTQLFFYFFESFSPLPRPPPPLSGRMHTLPRPLKDEEISSRLSSSLIQVLSPVSFELDEHDGLAVASEDRWQLYNKE